MGDINDSIVAIIMTLIAAASDGSTGTEPDAAVDTGWEHFAMVASDIRSFEPVTACAAPSAGTAFSNGYGLSPVDETCAAPRGGETRLR